ncbi:MAG: DUF5680 domain-containing protein [bacterium]|nr:DUF5680 domain-containing protein [bacterium]
MLRVKEVRDFVIESRYHHLSGKESERPAAVLLPRAEVWVYSRKRFRFEIWSVGSKVTQSQELVFADEEPIWGMTLRGLLRTTRRDADAFLRQVSRQLLHSVRLGRGEIDFEDGGMVYYSQTYEMFNSGFGKFAGYETAGIYMGPDDFYESSFAGGWIKN